MKGQLHFAYVNNVAKNGPFIDIIKIREPLKFHCSLASHFSTSTCMQDTDLNAGQVGATQDTDHMGNRSPSPSSSIHSSTPHINVMDKFRNKSWRDFSRSQIAILCAVHSYIPKYETLLTQLGYDVRVLMNIKPPMVESYPLPNILEAAKQCEVKMDMSFTYCTKLIRLESGVNALASCSFRTFILLYRNKDEYLMRKIRIDYEMDDPFTVRNMFFTTPPCELAFGPICRMHGTAVMKWLVDDHIITWEDIICKIQTWKKKSA